MKKVNIIYQFIAYLIVLYSIVLPILCIIKVVHIPF